MSSISSVLAEDTKNDSMNSYSYQLMWVNVTSIDTYVEESSSGLDAYAIIIPNDDEMVKGTLYLQKYKNGHWSTVEYWRLNNLYGENIFY